MAKQSFISLVFFLHAALLISICFGSKSWHSKRQVALFIFGDSYLDSGNNNYINTTTLDQANFLPYGETYFKFPTGRFSDGRLMSDFIAEYAHLPFVPPFLQPGFHQYYGGANFASAGAGALVETFQGEVIDLKTQLKYYKKVETWFRHKLGNVEAKVTFSRAVYLFSIGTNDYISPFLTNSPMLKSYPRSQYVGMVIGNLTSVIKEIYAGGGRKFGFINLLDSGCLPGVRIIKPENNGSCLKEVSSLAKLHNQALSKLLIQLGNQLEVFKYSLYDLNSNLRQRIRHPSKYVIVVVFGTGHPRIGFLIPIINKVSLVLLLSFGIIFATLLNIVSMLVLIVFHFPWQLIMLFHLVLLTILPGTLIREPLTT
ncbi:unnamed protein product [Malus baccata var. baccata]